MSILEDESVTLGDEFLSVDQLLILFFLCHSRDLQLYYKKKRLNKILVKVRI